MFSQYFKYLLHELQFVFIVIVRFIKILFRWRKKIQLLHLDYETEHLFQNSFILINYRFKNALWYRFGKHKTLEKQIKIFNLKNLESGFDLIVYGFFQKKVYNLKFAPQLRLENSNFKTSFSNLTLKLEEKVLLKPKHSNIYCSIPKPIISNQNIEIKIDVYNQNEFI